MVNLLIRHKIEDYGEWKAVFDGYRDSRHAQGERSWRAWTSTDDANDLFVLCSWDTLENAKAFMANPDLIKAMRTAGVLGEPEFFFLEERGRGKTTIAIDLVEEELES